MALDREQVVKAALDLMDEVGLEGLTLRRLAKDLGVQAPALYWHFKNKQELLDQMAEFSILTELPPVRPLAPGEDWGEWLAEHSQAARRVLVSRRDAALLAAWTKPRETQWDQIEAQVAVLCGVGFTPARALRGMFALSNYVAGFTLEEQADNRRDPEKRVPSPDDMVAFLTKLDRQYPYLARGIREVGDPQNDATFEYGLDLIITGMRASLAVPSDHHPPP